MSESLEKLRALTSELVPPVTLLSLATEDKCPSVVEYACDQGTAIGLALFHNESVAVQRTLFTKSTTFPAHSHKGVEWVVVYSGRFKIIMSTSEVTLGPGEAFMIPPEVPHMCRALEDTWLISITIPASEGYPNV